MFFFGKTVPTFALLAQADAKWQADYRALEARAAQRLLPSYADTRPVGELYEARAVEKGLSEEQEHARRVIQTAMLRIVAEGLKRQATVSVNSRGVCSYRGESGVACAVGHLIPDRLYSEEFEGCTIYSVQGFVFRGWRPEEEGEALDEHKAHVLWEVLSAQGVTREDLEVLGDLQDSHDSSHFGGITRGPGWWLAMRRRLVAIAEANGLDTSVIPE